MSYDDIYQAAKRATENELRGRVVSEATRRKIMSSNLDYFLEYPNEVSTGGCSAITLVTQLIGLPPHKAKIRWGELTNLGSDGVVKQFGDWRQLGPLIFALQRRVEKPTSMNVAGGNLPVGFGVYQGILYPELVGLVYGPHGFPVACALSRRPFAYMIGGDVCAYNDCMNSNDMYNMYRDTLQRALKSISDRNLELTAHPSFIALERTLREEGMDATNLKFYDSPIFWLAYNLRIGLIPRYMRELDALTKNF